MAVAEAVQAQTAVIQSLMEELRATRSTQGTPSEKKPVKKTPDKAPAKSSRRGGWYYGR